MIITYNSPPYERVFAGFGFIKMLMPPPSPVMFQKESTHHAQNSILFGEGLEVDIFTNTMC